MSPADTAFGQFSDVVTSEDDITAIIGTPMPQVLRKVTDRLDDTSRDFIAKSSFCVVATANPAGHIDLSPKGDPPGFVRVLDDRYLAIPDRPGNRRVDTFHNLLRDPRVGIIFMIPGKGETLRISGEARIVRDEDLRRSMAVDGHVPDLAIAVRADRVFMHCPKCMIRSKMWQPDTWPDSGKLPDIGQAMIRQGGLEETPEELFAKVEQEGLTRLY